jgi:hypothetical protein
MEFIKYIFCDLNRKNFQKDAFCGQENSHNIHALLGVSTERPVLLKNQRGKLSIFEFL